MSFAASTWAWDEAPVGGVDKLVLLWLAEANGLASPEEVSAQCGISYPEAVASLTRLYLCGAWEWIAGWQDRDNKECSARAREQHLLTRIPKALRVAVMARDGFVCQLCTLAVEPEDVSLDHRIPLSKGGPTTYENLQVAHRRCNSGKRDRILP
jgi:5-methylcytosine-specific restriction endonuclease McrA